MQATKRGTAFMAPGTGKLTPLTTGGLNVTPLIRLMFTTTEKVGLPLGTFRVTLTPHDPTRSCQVIAVARAPCVTKRIAQHFFSMISLSTHSNQTKRPCQQAQPTMMSTTMQQHVAASTTTRLATDQNQSSKSSNRVYRRTQVHPKQYRRSNQPFSHTGTTRQASTWLTTRDAYY